MNKIIIGIALLITFQNANAQFSLDHYSPSELLAKEGIDTCSIYVLNEDGSLTIEQSYIYDTMGREIENRRDFQEFSFTYQFDMKGQKVSEYFVPFGEGFYERDTLLYDKKDRLIKQITFNRKGTESKRNEYDYKGILLKEERYILSRKLQTRSLYHYDKEKRLAKVERYFRGKHDEDWLYEHDLNGNLISFTVISANGDTTLLHKFEYNKAGLRIKHSVFSAGKKLSTVYITEYDSKGLIVWMESITKIENNKISTGEVEKTIYKYSFR